LEADLEALATGQVGYRSQLAPAKKGMAGDFDHLARVAEWSLASSDEGNEESEA
jgi:hypothetical protein